jgi:uncharacterized membrane protein (Fun14 family)
MTTDLAPFAGTVGGGFFIGFIIGYAIKKVIKLAGFANTRSHLRFTFYLRWPHYS